MVCGGGVVKSRVITSINKMVLALERGFFVQTEFSLSSKVQFVPGEAVEVSDVRHSIHQFWSLHLWYPVVLASQSSLLLSTQMM